MSRLDAASVERVSGPKWAPLRDAFLQLSDALLSAAPDATGNLTTIYTKYQVTRAGKVIVYAVAWTRKSSEIVVGLALPPGTTHDRLHKPPARMEYPALTSYFTVTTEQPVPPEVAEWAAAALAHVGG